MDPEIDISSYIRSVPDFPKPGINFYDITTLLADPTGFKLTLDAMDSYIRSTGPDKLVAAESRGFLFAAALADRLNLPLIPARKPGKLPAETISEKYHLEYGTDRMEIHADAISQDDRVVIVDDLIATGGTLRAICTLVERCGGKIVGISAVIDLSFLPWREKLADYDVNYLISFDSE